MGERAVRSRGQTVAVLHPVVGRRPSRVASPGRPLDQVKRLVPRERGVQAASGEGTLAEGRRTPPIAKRGVGVKGPGVADAREGGVGRCPGISACECRVARSAVATGECGVESGARGGYSRSGRRFGDDCGCYKRRVLVEGRSRTQTSRGQEQLGVLVSGIGLEN